MSPQQEPPAILHAKQIEIHNSSFIQHNHPNTHWPPTHLCSDAKDGLQHLHAHVAVAAFDPKNKVDAPKCHPNTRNAVLDEIINWVMQITMRAEWILWLNGAAGAGKSSIGRTFMEICAARDIALAGIFFFRSDPTRNTIEPIVATLIYQLIKCLPDLENIIIPKISRDPLIFTKSLQTQFTTLIFDSLRQLKSNIESPRTLVLLFDGLDELSGHENQTELVRIMAAFVASRAYPLLTFFGSRAENQIKQVFSSRHVYPLLFQIPLDSNYKADDDIRLFLNESFADIHDSHPHSRLLPRDWPAPGLVDRVVTKSSGQFIYASIAVNFISMPKMHPAQQLEIICGLRPAGRLIPFAQLDALYHCILSQVEDLPSTMRILAAIILCEAPNVAVLSQLFPDYMSYSSIHISLASLSSIISVRDYPITFLHTSLSDFLLDGTRSLQYHIDWSSWSTQLVTELTTDPAPLSKYLTRYTHLLAHAKPTDAMKQRLRTVYLKGNMSEINMYLGPYLATIRDMDLGDGGLTYRLQLKNHVEQLIFNPFNYTMGKEYIEESDLLMARAMYEAEKNGGNPKDYMMEDLPGGEGGKTPTTHVVEVAGEEPAALMVTVSPEMSLPMDETPQEPVLIQDEGAGKEKKRSWGGHAIGRSKAWLRKFRSP